MQPKVYSDGKKYKRMVAGKAIAIGVMAALLIILALMKLSVDICEWYSLNISANLIKAANVLTGWIPFSLFEILIYAAVALAISFFIFIIVALCRKQFRRALNSFVNLALIVVIVGTVYGAFAILPYGRASADIPAYENSQLEGEKVYDMTESYIAELSRLAKNQDRADNGELVISGGLKGLNESLQATYERVLTSDYYYDTDSKLKKWLWPELMSAFSISGIFFAPTAECNVCTAYYTTTTIAAAAHEMAQKGVPLTKESLCKKYLRLNRAYYGKAVESDKEISYEWARIPHFYTSFYVYKYATGLVSALFIADRILKEGKPAVEDYFKFLSSGGSADPVSLLKIAGVDLTKKDAFDGAMRVFGDTLSAFLSVGA